MSQTSRLRSASLDRDFAHTGTPHALVLVIRRGCNEQAFQAILDDQQRCSGVNLGSQSQDKRLLQVLTWGSGQSNTPQPLLQPSTINDQNRNVLEELLGMTLGLTEVSLLTTGNAVTNIAAKLLVVIKMTRSPLQVKARRKRVFGLF